MLSNFIAQYWEIIVAFLFLIALVFVGWKTSGKSAIVYAKNTAKAFMFLAEKKAEALLLSTGADKFKFVVNEAYNYFPAIVRTFVSKPLFESIVQELYDETVGLIKSHTEQPAVSTGGLAVQQATTEGTPQQ